MYRFGMPNRIITDLGSPFTATEFKSWAQDCGFSIDYASVAHPEANGQVERANGLILAGLKPRLYEKLADYGPKWIEELPKVVRGPGAVLFGLQRMRNSMVNARDSRFILVRALDCGRVIALRPVGVSLCVGLMVL